MYNKRGDYDRKKEELRKLRKEKSKHASVEEESKLRAKEENYSFWNKEFYSELDIKQAYENIRYESFFISY